MLLPAKIGDYWLVKFLGGGMSSVYEARDELLGRTVAVKILTHPGCDDESTRTRFSQEARTLAKLTHDNILRIYHVGDYEGQPFMVMEFLRGPDKDLSHAIYEGHTGDLKDKLRIALQVARALLYIHSLGIIHRDVKPGNIHINEAGVVRLLDFGIAKTAGLVMTQAGNFVGTPSYMAPEQVNGNDITEQVDVYAFGVLLFELLTGMKPFLGENIEQTFYRILNEPISLEPLRQAETPKEVCDFVVVCTAKNPKDRPQGFESVCKELERILAALEVPPIILPPPIDPELEVQITVALNRIEAEEAGSNVVDKNLRRVYGSLREKLGTGSDGPVCQVLVRCMDSEDSLTKVEGHAVTRAIRGNYC